MNAAAAYWNRGVKHVPVMTGASSLMDAQDIPELCASLGLDLPLRNVLDVGCGTGRIAKYCDGYIGVDIAKDAVKFAKKQGLNACVIDGADDLPTGHFDLVMCLSVFTHIDSPQRDEYLAAFGFLTERAVVDIIPGDGEGNIVAWTAEVYGFEQALADYGWTIVSTTERTCPSGPVHRYYRLERR